MRSSRRDVKHRCARRSRRPSRTPTAPTAARSRKARATKRERDGHAGDGRSPKRLPRGSRQAAKKVAEQRKPPRPSRKVNFRAAGEFRRRFNERHYDDYYKREVHSEGRSDPAPAHRRGYDGIEESTGREQR